MNLESLSPFALPLSLEQWRKALAVGHGRALLDARRFGGRQGLAPLVVEAGLKNQAYDPQCEDDRGAWVVSIAEACDLTEELRAAVVEALETEQPDAPYWDARQRRGIALHFAAEGNEAARRVLYTSFRKERDTLDLLGCDELIHLDGESGLTHVVRELGQLCTEDPELKIDTYPLEAFDELHGEGSARTVLHTARERDPLVRAFLERVDALEAADDQGSWLDLENAELRPDGRARHQERMRSIPVSDVVEEIKTEAPDKNRFWFPSWGRFAGGDDLEVVQKELVREKEPGRICKYLRVLFHSPVPNIAQELVALSSHNDRDVRWCANRVLANIDAPAIRELALRRIREGRMVEGELRLLMKSYAKGDHLAVENALYLPEDREELHAVVSDLVDVFDAQRTEECRLPMLFVYEHSPCSNCRCRALEVLLRDDTVPDWIREECGCDAQEEIRDLTARM